MRAIPWLLLFLAIASTNGCSCSHNGGKGSDAGNGSDDMSGVAGGDITIMPAEVTIDITSMGPAGTQAYTAISGTLDVTNQATWSVDDATLGSFSGSTFTSTTDHGGTTLVHASYNGLTGFATLHVKLHASVTDTCPGCPQFPGSGTPACTVTAQTPIILYPPDGTLVPPNMNVLETQFDQGTGNTLFEIDYENAVTDVTVETKCNPIADSKKNATNGCSYDLSQQVWDFLATSNRGGDPLNIIVKATDANGSCVATSTAKIAISFAQEDLVSGLYYWQSVNVAGLQGAAGGIFRYDFGVRGQAPTAFLSPTANGGNMQRCIGCHFLSRDGVKMTYGNDDPDADDEYGDLTSSLLDVATKAAVALGTKGGFQAFTPDHATLISSDGQGMNNPAAFYKFSGTSGAAGTPATVPSGGARATHPDWSPDGRSIVFTRPGSFTFSAMSQGNGNDSHFTGGSLYTMSYSATSVFGTPQVLLASQGENNYYPGFSPDGGFVIFNRVALSGTASGCMPSPCNSNLPCPGSCANDAFSNPNARVMLMPSSGGTPVDLAALNDSGALTNSWPRFAPTVQTYKGHQIAWVTFSSTRDYGDVVRNSLPVAGAPQFICYPPESPENPMGQKTNVTTDPKCMQPQLWMAAIDLTKAASGGDPSLPAFWLPFQDPTAHNHIAQWVVSLLGPPPPVDGGTDGGSCIPDGVTCTSGNGVCCNGICCGTGTCGCIP